MRVDEGPHQAVLGGIQVVPDENTDSACQGEAGAGYEAVEGVGPVLESFGAVVDHGFQAVEGGDGEVGEAACDVCAYPLDGVEIW